MEGWLHGCEVAPWLIMRWFPSLWGCSMVYCELLHFLWFGSMFCGLVAQCFLVSCLNENSTNCDAASPWKATNQGKPWRFLVWYVEWCSVADWSMICVRKIHTKTPKKQKEKIYVLWHGLKNCKPFTARDLTKKWYAGYYSNFQSDVQNDENSWSKCPCRSCETSSDNVKNELSPPRIFFYLQEVFHFLKQ